MKRIVDQIRGHSTHLVDRVRAVLPEHGLDRFADRQGNVLVVMNDVVQSHHGLVQFRPIVQGVPLDGQRMMNLSTHVEKVESSGAVQDVGKPAITMNDRFDGAIGKTCHPFGDKLFHVMIHLFAVGKWKIVDTSRSFFKLFQVMQTNHFIRQLDSVVERGRVYPLDRGKKFRKQGGLQQSLRVDLVERCTTQVLQCKTVGRDGLFQLRKERSQHRGCDLAIEELFTLQAGSEFEDGVFVATHDPMIPIGGKMRRRGEVIVMVKAQLLPKRVIERIVALVVDVDIAVGFAENEFVIRNVEASQRLDGNVADLSLHFFHIAATGYHLSGGVDDDAMSLAVQMPHPLHDGRIRLDRLVVFVLGRIRHDRIVQVKHKRQRTFLQPVFVLQNVAGRADGKVAGKIDSLDGFTVLKKSLKDERHIGFLADRFVHHHGSVFDRDRFRGKPVSSGANPRRDWNAFFHLSDVIAVDFDKGVMVERGTVIGVEKMIADGAGGYLPPFVHIVIVEKEDGVVFVGKGLETQQHALDGSSCLVWNGVEVESEMGILIDQERAEAIRVQLVEVKDVQFVEVHAERVNRVKDHGASVNEIHRFGEQLIEADACAATHQYDFHTNGRSTFLDLGRVRPRSLRCVFFFGEEDKTEMMTHKTGLLILFLLLFILILCLYRGTDESYPVVTMYCVKKEYITEPDEKGHPSFTQSNVPSRAIEVDFDSFSPPSCESDEQLLSYQPGDCIHCVDPDHPEYGDTICVPSYEENGKIITASKYCTDMLGRTTNGKVFTW